MKDQNADCASGVNGFVMDGGGSSRPVRDRVFDGSGAATDAGLVRQSAAMTTVTQPACCIICTQLTEADQRYLRRLQADRKMRHALTDALVASMGFCAHHWHQLQDAGPDTAKWSGQCVSEATVRLGELFARTRLQDEFLQDLLFGARGRCPACLFFHRMEGRLLSRALHDLENKNISLRSLFSTQICFEHARQLVARTDGSLRARMRSALRKRGEHILSEALSANIANPSDAQVTERMLVQHLYPHATVRQVQPVSDTSDACGCDSCPVCLAMEDSRRHWLAAVVENIRLGQPAWLTLPTCAEHTIMAVETGGPGVALAVTTRYLDASLMPPARKRIPAPDRKRRCHSHRWFNARSVNSESVTGASPASAEAIDESILSVHCPGCQQADVVMRRAVFSFLHAFSPTTDAQGPSKLRQLCLKHLSEVMIYAPDERTQTRLVGCLNRPDDEARIEETVATASGQ